MAEKVATAKPLAALLAVKRLDGVKQLDGGAIKLELFLNPEAAKALVERANMANFERSVIKDNTLLLGEWYGGQLHIQPLISQDGL